MGTVRYVADAELKSNPLPNSVLLHLQKKHPDLEKRVLWGHLKQILVKGLHCYTGSSVDRPA